jgi:hypothetical protein
MSRDGQVTPQQWGQAVKLLRKAAEHGNAEAQLQLGSMYFQGTGVPKDYSEAANWFKKAAEKGNVVAQLSLGDMYYGELVEGFQKDYI